MRGATDRSEIQERGRIWPNLADFRLLRTAVLPAAIRSTAREGNPMHRLPLFYFASIASALVAYLEIHRSSSIWGPRTEVRNQDVIPRRQSTPTLNCFETRRVSPTDIRAICAAVQIGLMK